MTKLLLVLTLGLAAIACSPRKVVVGRVVDKGPYAWVLNRDGSYSVAVVSPVWLDQALREIGCPPLHAQPASGVEVCDVKSKGSLFRVTPPQVKAK